MNLAPLPRSFRGLAACALLAGGASLRGQGSVPARHFLITDFGAVAGGKTLDTAAIQRTIDQAAAAGGGVVEVPKGTFLTGSVFLKPGVELYLDEGGVLFGSDRIEDYPKRVTRIEGHFEPWRMALVNAQEMDRVRIGGKGRLDGNGFLFWAAFWQRRHENPACTNLEVERPRLLFIDRCRDVKVSGIRLLDSGFWNLHLYKCRGVEIEGLDIKAPTAGPILGPSTDGIDVDSCQDVAIRGCRISVNDDDVALKGSKGPTADQDADSPPVENIRIEDCEIVDGNGITCGSEATVVRQVLIRHCRVTGKANFLTLKLRPDTPQDYEDITAEDIELDGGGRLLNVAPWRQFFNLAGHAPPTQKISHVVLRDVRGSFRAFGVLQGNPGDTLSGIVLENVHLTLADPTLRAGPGVGLVFREVTVNGRPAAAP